MILKLEKIKNDTIESFQFSFEDDKWIEKLVNIFYEKGNEIKSSNISNFLSNNIDYILKANDENLEQLWELINEHFNNVHVVGFNSSRFDLHLINQYFISENSTVVNVLGDC
jgi:hydroxymethylpyrimidine pyrophosphatase-like HAD family hydrolase